MHNSLSSATLGLGTAVELHNPEGEKNNLVVELHLRKTEKCLVYVDSILPNIDLIISPGWSKLTESTGAW